MLTQRLENKSDRDQTRARNFLGIFPLIAPPLLLIGGLFGGGLLLSILQVSGAPADSIFSLDFRYFNAVMADQEFLSSLALSLYIATTSTLLAAGISLLAALAIMRWAQQNRLVYLLLQVPLTVPHLVVALAFLLLLAPSGLISRVLFHLGIIDSQPAFPLLVNDPFTITILLVYIWKEVPFITLTLLAVLKNAGTELSEAAATLGAGSWQRFRFVLLPILRPALGGACGIVYAYTFGAYEVPWLLGQSYPRPLPVVAYRYFSDTDLTTRPEGIALGLLIVAIVITAIIFFNWLTRILMAPGN